MVDYRICVPSGNAHNLKILQDSLNDDERSKLLVADTRDQARYRNAWTINGLMEQVPRDAVAILANDDLHRRHGRFVELAEVAVKHRCIVGAAVIGNVFNHSAMRYDANASFDLKPMRWMPLFCAAIPSFIRATVGGFDTRFDDGYGYDDHDYCERARARGFSLCVSEALVVVHDHGAQRSAWRERPDFHKRLQMNRAIFKDKWGYEAC